MIPGNRGRGLREVKQKRWESQSHGVSSGWTLLCSAGSGLLKPSVELSRMGSRVVLLAGERESLIGQCRQPLPLSPSSCFRMAAHIAMLSSQAKTEESGVGERDTKLGRQVLEARCRRSGCSKKADKEDVRWSKRGVWYFLLPEWFFLSVLKPQSYVVIKSIHSLGTWWVLSKRRQLFRTFMI